MDPNEALDDLRRAIKCNNADETYEAFTHLDEWLRKGGFLPSDWCQPEWIGG